MNNWRQITRGINRHARTADMKESMKQAAEDQVKAYLSEIGRRGGQKSKRTTGWLGKTVANIGLLNQAYLASRKAL